MTHEEKVTYLREMMRIFEASESQGLGYALQHGYIKPNTKDADLNTAITRASKDITTIQASLNTFQNKLNDPTFKEARQELGY